MSFASVLTLIFIVLKLIGIITWSWWWVVSPTLIVLGFAATLFVVAGFIAAGTK